MRTPQKTPSTPTPSPDSIRVTRSQSRNISRNDGSSTLHSDRKGQFTPKNPIAVDKSNESPEISSVQSEPVLGSSLKPFEISDEDSAHHKSPTPSCRGAKKKKQIKNRLPSSRRSIINLTTSGLEQNNTEVIIFGSKQDNTELTASGSKQNNTELTASGSKQNNTEPIASGSKQNNTELTASGSKQNNTEPTASGSKQNNTEPTASGSKQNNEPEHQPQPISPEIPSGAERPKLNDETLPPLDVAEKPIIVNLASGSCDSGASTLAQKDAAADKVKTQNAKSPEDVDKDLMDFFKKDLSGKDKPGKIYVARATVRPDLGLKIGRSVAPKARTDQQKANCKLDIEKHFESNIVEKYDRTEKLVHRELSSYNVHWLCDLKGCGGTVHQEYFHVDLGVAIETIKKWEAFMVREKPYSEAGQLNFLWVYLIDKRQLTCPLPEGKLTQEAVRERWRLLLEPPTLGDYVCAYGNHLFNTACFHMQNIQRFFWQFTSVCYSMSMVVLCRNTLALYAFFFILFCTGISVSNHLPKKPKTASK